MRSSLLSVLLFLSAATAADAASHPFYRQMLDRGVASVREGRDTEALKELKIAAFGMVNDLPMYQKAQVYLAVVNERLNRSNEARMAAAKFLQAERLSNAYATMELPPATREAFEKVAASAADPDFLASIPSFRRAAPREVSTVASASTEAVLPAATPPPAATPQIQEIVVAPPSTEPGAVGHERGAPVPAATPLTSPTPAKLEETTVAQPPQPQPRRPIALPAARADVSRRIDEARELLASGDRAGARQILLAVATEEILARADLILIGESLNALGAWRESSAAFTRVLPWQEGEDQQMFLEAVNRYEMGERKAARVLLDRALPNLPPTREVAIYRGMIEAATRLP